MDFRKMDFGKLDLGKMDFCEKEIRKNRFREIDFGILGGYREARLYLEVGYFGDSYEDWFGLGPKNLAALTNIILISWNLASF